VDARGWYWTASEIRQARLIEWIGERCAERPASEYVPVAPFYGALPDQEMNTYQIARGDLDFLASRSLLRLAAGLGGIESLDVLATPEGRAFAEGLQAARANKQSRRSACRDAMVDWLYSRDALIPPGAIRDTMLQDPQHGYWFAEPFSADDLDIAAAWLRRQGLVKGTGIGQMLGPVILYLTDAGVMCAENFGADAGAYLEKQQYRAGPGPTVSIGVNRGPVQVAGDNSRQVQNIGIRPDDLKQLITGIAEIVRALVPDAPNADQEHQAALAAIGGDMVDRSVLERFRDWAVNTVRAGATSAAVAAVSSVTTTLLIEAGHLASHIG
jgi:hypothetical protein